MVADAERLINRIRQVGRIHGFGCMRLSVPRPRDCALDIGEAIGRARGRRHQGQAPCRLRKSRGRQNRGSALPTALNSHARGSDRIVRSARVIKAAASQAPLPHSIYNVVGSVKYFLKTPHRRRAEPLDSVPSARVVRAESEWWCFFITRSILKGRCRSCRD
jgi:hypothetical protein